MAVDEAARHTLYTTLQEKLGMQPATTLIDYLPPVGWADVATKHDLEALREWVQVRFDAQDARLDARLAAQDAKLAEVRADLRSDLADVRANLQTGLADVRADLQTGLADARGGLQTGLADVRAGLRGDLIGALLIMFGLIVALITLGGPPLT